MNTCSLCKGVIDVGKPAVSIVGGLFPREAPDFFMVDEQVMRESHAHLQCLLDRIGPAQQQQQKGSL